MSTTIKISAFVVLSVTLASGAFAATKNHAHQNNAHMESVQPQAAPAEPGYFMQAKGNIDA